MMPLLPDFLQRSKVQKNNSLTHELSVYEEQSHTSIKPKAFRFKPPRYSEPLPPQPKSQPPPTNRRGEYSSSGRSTRSSEFDVSSTIEKAISRGSSVEKLSETSNPNIKSVVDSYGDSSDESSTDSGYQASITS